MNDGRRPRAKLLWLGIEPPWPATSGGRLRTAALLHATATRFEVTLALLFGDPPADRGPLADFEWVTSSAGARGKLASTAAHLVHRRPPYLRHFSTSRQKRTIARALEEGGYSIVVADTPYAAAALPGGGAPRLVINAHNVEAEVWRAATAQVSGSRLLQVLDRRLVPAWERRTLARADGVAFSSERDRLVLQGGLHRGASVAVVPNAVDTDVLLPLDVPKEKDEVLFVGGLDYGPNREAAAFIADALGPLLARAGVTALIAGGDAADLVGAHRARAVRLSNCANGVRFLGRPVDLLSAYERSHATIVPLFSGSGTRLKVLESFAYGRPVVSTAKGVEGLAVEPGVHYLPAESVEQFAAQIAALRDLRLAERLARSGRSLVEQRYSWGVAGASFLKLLEETLT